MYRNCPEEPNTAYQLINGDPPQQDYSRDDVEVVELGQERYAEIIENRSKQSDER